MTLPSMLQDGLRLQELCHEHGELLNHFSEINLRANPGWDGRFTAAQLDALDCSARKVRAELEGGR